VALFFDQNWFNERLEAVGLSRSDLATALGLTGDELDAMWKDQREILEREIGTMALLLGVAEDEVRKRGGIQGSPEARAALRQRQGGAIPAAARGDEADLEARVDAVERRLNELEARLQGKSKAGS
jgi:hypothetical protein